MASNTFYPQDPIELARLYGNDKNKLVRAIAAGVPMHPTSALLAGIYIDAENAKPTPDKTVAQQVLAPSAPPAPPAGLGAIGPQGGAMPPAPPPPPAGLGAMPPVGMAAGGMTELPTSYGLDSLPIPDNMYDEQSFAGGGIVAFAKGSPGEVEEEGFFDRLRNRDFTGRNKEPTEDELRILKEKIRVGRLSKNSGDGVNLLAALNKPYEGPRGLSLMSSLLPDFTGNKDIIPVEPTMVSPVIPEARMPQFAIAPKVAPPAPAPAPAPAPRGDRGVADIAPRATRTGAATPEDDYGLPKAPGEFDRQKFFDEILKMQGPAPGMEKMSDEEKAARKNEDFYGSLLEFAANLAGGASGNFLTDAGKAMVAASPGVRESLKERRAEAREERKDELERKKLEYGARGTAAAATRAEETAMRTYGLNLAEARAKIAHDRATLALDIRKANALADYYRQSGRDRDAAMVNRLSNALQRIAKNPNDEEAIAERDAIQQLQGRGLGLSRSQLTPDQALRQATNETESFNFVLPKGMTVQQYIDKRKLELMGGGGGSNRIRLDAAGNPL